VTVFLWYKEGVA